MDRRSVLCALAAGVTATTAGCLGGEVVHEVQRSVRIDPGGYWVSRMPGVGGSGAISYAVRAETRFDVYVFSDRDEYDAYLAFHETGTADRTPTGRDRLGTTATYDEDRELYSATTADDGARESFDAETESYFVVDHSSYGMGAEPGENASDLSVFVDLEVVEKQLGL